MKSALFIVEGTTQVVLTPESEWERTVCAQIAKHSGRVSILHGSFYECHGGWWRQEQYPKESDLILRLDAPKPEAETT